MRGTGGHSPLLHRPLHRPLSHRSTVPSVQTLEHLVLPVAHSNAPRPVQRQLPRLQQGRLRQLILQGQALPGSGLALPRHRCAQVHVCASCQGSGSRAAGTCRRSCVAAQHGGFAADPAQPQPAVPSCPPAPRRPGRVSAGGVHLVHPAGRPLRRLGLRFLGRCHRPRRHGPPLVRVLRCAVLHCAVRAVTESSGVGDLFLSLWRPWGSEAAAQTASAPTPTLQLPAATCRCRTCAHLPRSLCRTCSPSSAGLGGSATRQPRSKESASTRPSCPTHLSRPGSERMVSQGAGGSLAWRLCTGPGAACGASGLSLH